MGQQIRIELDREGHRALLNSIEVQGDLKARGDRIAEAAGDGHQVTVRHGGSRARATVATVSEEAKRQESESRALLRALEAGAG